jgi:4-amino-4-deoxy-L-arabinose transferase-like glycosyltransferase
MMVYFFWKSINKNNFIDWITTGFLGALGILTHYSFIFLILSLFIYFIFFTKKDKKVIKYFFTSFLIFFLMIVPHIFWLYENNFSTFNYALNRTGLENKNLIDHIYNPVIFIFKQIGMLALFTIIFLSIVSLKKKNKLSIYKVDKKKIFLLSINLLPILIVFFVSLISGTKIRTMWMSTFYLFFGILFFYYFQKLIDLKKVKNFLYIFLFLFFLSPVTYFWVSTTDNTKRTDFPGKEISRLVQNKWNDNFVNDIKIVVGDEWAAGNLSYHLNSRPAWFNSLKNKSSTIDEDKGVIYVGNPKILKKICPGVFGEIAPIGYCMIGKR